MLNVKVFKAFVYTLAVTLVTMGATWLTVGDNVLKLGVSPALVPVIVGIAGAAVIAIRRFNIEKKN